MAKVLRFVKRGEGSIGTISHAMMARYGHGTRPAVNATEWEGRPPGTCRLQGAKATADGNIADSRLVAAIEIDVPYNPDGWWISETAEFNEIDFGHFVGEFDEES